MRRQPIVEVIERTEAAKRADRTVIMEMSTVFGKPLGKLTGAEGRQLDGWQAEVFKDVGDADVLDASRPRKSCTRYMIAGCWGPHELTADAIGAANRSSRARNTTVTTEASVFIAAIFALIRAAATGMLGPKAQRERLPGPVADASGAVNRLRPRGRRRSFARRHTGSRHTVLASSASP
jgi:hypothetical protein